MLSMRDRALEERWHQRRSLVIPAPRPAVQPAFRAPDEEGRLESGAALIWERLQEQAVRAYLEGDGALSFRNWARALEIAETSFEHADPRLAASLTNHGHALQQKNCQHQALRLFARAKDSWEHGWRWVRRMTPPAGATSYDEEARARFMTLLHLGQQTSAAIARMEPASLNGLSRFEAIRPRQMSDLRALLAAVFLLVPGPGDRRPS